MKLPCVRVDKKYSTRSLISWYDPKLNPSLKNSSSRLEKCPDSGISVSCTGWKRWMLRNGSFHSVEKPIVQNAKIGRPWWEFIPESAHTVRKQISCRVSIKNLKNLNCFKMLARPILGTGAAVPGTNKKCMEKDGKSCWSRHTYNLVIWKHGY